MGKPVKYGVLIVLLSLFLGFILEFPSFATAYVVKPIAILLWAAWRIASSLHQSVYWSFLIVLCLTLMIRLLPAGRNRAPSPPYEYKHESSTRVERWQVLLNDSVSGDDESAALREGLRKLLASMISPGAPSTPLDLKEALASTRTSLPPAAQAYLFPSSVNRKRWSDRYGEYILSRTPNGLRRWLGKPGGPDQAAIDELLQWMESYMEVKSDR